MVTRALQLHHLDDLLHGLASSHWALEKRSLLVLGRRSISGLKRGSKCIQFLVHGRVVVPLALGCLLRWLLRWFAGLRPVTWYSPLCHGVYWFCGGGENFLSHMTFWLTYYLVLVINSKIFCPGVTPGFPSTRSRDSPLGTWRVVFLGSLFGWGYSPFCFSFCDYVINYWIFGKLRDFRETTITVSAFSNFTNSSIYKLANYTIYDKKTQQIIILSYGHSSSKTGRVTW